MKTKDLYYVMLILLDYLRKKNLEANHAAKPSNHAVKPSNHAVKPSNHADRTPNVTGKQNQESEEHQRQAIIILPIMII